MKKPPTSRHRDLIARYESPAFLSNACWRSVGLGIALSLGLLGSARAVDPGLHISQYARTVWRSDAGDYAGTVTVVSQTSDGYLWVGTTGGLVRFDGARFVPISSEPMRNREITDLLPARDGSLWMGTRSGVWHLKDGTLSSNKDDLGYISGLAEGEGGAIWASRTRLPASEGPLCRVSLTDTRCLHQADGVNNRYVVSMARAPDGALWLSDLNSLTRWKAGSSTTYDLPPSGVKANVKGLQALALAPDGSLWAGSDYSGTGLGLQRFVDGHWMPFNLPGLEGASLHVHTLLLDRQGALWVGTNGQGLYRIHDGQAEHFGSADGLSSDTVTALFQDSEGDLWVGTPMGLERFRDVRVVNYSSREGLSQDNVNAVLAARDGSVWVQNTHTLDHLRDGKVSSTRLPEDLPGHVLTSMLEDDRHRLWLGVDDGMVIFDGGQVRHVASLDGKPLGPVNGIVQDKAGDVWLATTGATRSRLLRARDDRVQEELTEQLPALRSGVMAPDPDGGLWLAVREQGLVLYRDGRITKLPFNDYPGARPINGLIVPSAGTVLGSTAAGLVSWHQGATHTMTTRNGLPCASIHAMAQDGAGTLWLYSECGLMAISPAELERWWRSPEAVLDVRTYDAMDGVRPAFSNYSPRVSNSPDGRMWFANGHLLEAIDPTHMSRKAVAPQVHIESLSADGATYAFPTGVRLPSHTRDIEIDYTATVFAIPQRVRFRYRLEGRDNAWQDPGTRRQAFFTNLPPGDYRFHVIASNDDGVWNEAGATLAFTIPPTFVQTRWFIALCVLAGLALTGLLLRARVRQVGAQLRIRFEERVAERERIARELHDTLLQSTQGLILIVQGAARRLAPNNPDRAMLEQAVALADGVAAEGRNRVQDLRVPADSPEDLPQAFSDVGRQLEESYPARLRVHVVGEADELQPEVKDEIFRIGREGLINAFRHAQAAAIELEIDYGAAEFALRLRDDGAGFDAQSDDAASGGHWGLRGMRERAERIGARLTIDSSREAGTQLQVRVPADRAFVHHGRTSFLAWLRRLV